MLEIGPNLAGVLGGVILGLVVLAFIYMLLRDSDA